MPEPNPIEEFAARVSAYMRCNYCLKDREILDVFERQLKRPKRETERAAQAIAQVCMREEER